MKRLLVDLNVLLDVLLGRAPHVEASAALWARVEQGPIEGWISAHGVTTIFYLAARARDRTFARGVVTDLLSVFHVAPVDERTLRRATALDLPDFEDAVSAAAAEATACDAIVTRNAADFAGSPVEPMEPILALAALDSMESGGDDEVHEGAAAYAAPPAG